MFKVEMLPAKFGDSFWITYSSDGAGEHRILIDGGTGRTRDHIIERIEALPADDRRIDLVVVTHIDNDHIAGILTMLQLGVVDVEIGDFWFNGRKHLPTDLLGSKQGEKLSKVIEDKGIAWNEAFSGNAVVLPEDLPLPVIDLPGGMTLTLLSPTRQALVDLIEPWDDELEKAGLLLTQDDNQDEAEQADDNGSDLLSVTLPDVLALADSDFDGDDAEANGSSIAFLLEFEGKRALFTADAHVEPLLAAFELLAPGTQLAVDFCKISHHGSKGTTSKSLIEKLDCKRYAITTNGSIFHHPHHETIARILVAGSSGLELLFNYRSDDNKIWGNLSLTDDFNYMATYPAAGKEGLEVII